MVYAGFWRRLGAYLIDIIVLLPLFGINYYFGEQYRLFNLYWFLPGLIFGLWFSVYLVFKYGGTPGKLILKTRIAMIDGSPIAAKSAILRYSVLFILSTISSAAILSGYLNMSDELYFSLSYMERAKKLVELAPSWYGFTAVLINIWVWGEFVTILFNKKRRAVHDFIAGTVVVKNDVTAQPITQAGRLTALLNSNVIDFPRFGRHLALLAPDLFKCFRGHANYGEGKLIYERENQIHR